MPGRSGVDKPGKFYAPAKVNPDYVRLDQQYVEVVNSGDPASIKVRLDQQYVEVVNSGDPASVKVRLDQQYIEVICTFGTAPVQTNNGKKDKPPGKNKAAVYVSQDMRWRRMQVMDRKRQARRFMSVAAFAVPPVFVSPGDHPKRAHMVDKVITSGGDGHAVRYREA